MTTTTNKTNALLWRVTLADRVGDTQWYRVCNGVGYPKYFTTSIAAQACADMWNAAGL